MTKLETRTIMHTNSETDEPSVAGSLEDAGSLSDGSNKSKSRSNHVKWWWCVGGSFILTAAVVIAGALQIASRAGVADSSSPGRPAAKASGGDASAAGRPVASVSRDAFSDATTGRTARNKTRMQMHTDVRKKLDGPSLFCFVVMLPYGNERELVKMQYEKGLSIFACDEHVVLSNITFSINPDRDGGEKTVAFGGGNMQVKFNTWTWSTNGVKLALNTEVFLRAWKEIFWQGNWQKHDWIVKVDPDTVFLPSRLRYLMQDRKLLPTVQSSSNSSSCNKCQIPYNGKSCSEHVVLVQSKGLTCQEALKEVAQSPPTNCGCHCDVDACHKPQSVYLRNCEANMYHPWDKVTNHALHGPLEVMSRNAVQDLELGLSQCEDKLADSFGQWGEDWFLEHCLKSIGVNPLDSFTSLKDGDCGTIAEPCDQPHAAFQPFKSVSKYLKCHDNAVKNGKWPPTEPQYKEHKYMSPHLHMWVVHPWV